MRSEALARALGGHRCGSGWIACCPAHHDSHPSLSVRDSPEGKVLIHCHAGCGQVEVIAALRGRGLWDRHGRPGPRPAPAAPIRPDGPDASRIRRTEAAAGLWRVAVPAHGSPVERYLRSRGITGPIPPSLRFHSCLKHPCGTVWPGMIALVQHSTSGQATAVHRTFLTRDGSGKAPVTPQKMMLGPCRGGAVRLAGAAGHLLVGEGIETCFAAMQATGVPAWAALSTSGLCTLVVPVNVREVTVLADGDDAGEKAAQRAALRWKREGRRVRIARPPRALDFNDLLLGRGPRNAESASC